jgi:hypothetical protein
MNRVHDFDYVSPSECSGPSSGAEWKGSLGNRAKAAESFFVCRGVWRNAESRTAALREGSPKRPWRDSAPNHGDENSLKCSTRYRQPCHKAELSPVPEMTPAQAAGLRRTHIPGDRLMRTRSLFRIVLVSAVALACHSQD